MNIRDYNMAKIPVFFFLSTLLFSCALISNSAAQNASKTNYPQTVEGEYLIKLTKNTNGEKWVIELNYRYPGISIDYAKELSPTLNIHLIEIDKGEWSETQILEMLRTHTAVLGANPNRISEWRGSEPDDPFYSDQWNLRQIMAPEAWEISRGGVTALGDTIVIAVMDNGCQLDHPDLVGNIWVNRGEIPGDGIDNDNNGYIDDYYGLNVTTGNDQHSAGRHGTEVIGKAAAMTNNQEGISSINWHVKIMVLSKSGGGATEADMIEAYEYALDQRRRYNETDGAEGAFVVATNFSGGIPDQDPVDFPGWCGMYDAMGEVGILSTAATVNSNTNVDVFGDIPTTCPSPYLLSVTNSDRDDQKVSGAGHGKIHIDLAAPGISLTTPTTGSDYISGIRGTSLAAPQVTAAIALLYSVDCLDFAQLVKSNPAEAARSIKSAIINGVDQNPNLEEFTLSGGRLNLFNSILEIDNCETEFGEELAILSVFPNPSPGELFVEFESPDLGEYQLEITDLTGRRVLTTPIQTIPFSPNLRKVNIAQLPAGVYLLHIAGSSRSSTQKFIKY